MAASVYKSGWKTIGTTGLHVYKSGWKTVLGGYVYKSGWKQFHIGDNCANSPYIRNITDVLSNMDCSTDCAGYPCYMTQDSTITLSKALPAGFAVRFEVSFDGGTNYSLWEEGSSLSATCAFDTTGYAGCCHGCIDGSGICYFRCRMRAAIRHTASGDYCTEWTTGADSGTYEGNYYGKYWSCSI